MIDILKGLWDLYDTNHDGLIDGQDIPWPAGSLKAKKAWLAIEQEAHSPEVIAKAKKIHPDAHGMYQGRVLVKGVGPNQGDFNLLRDKLIYHSGYSPDIAAKIAGRVKAGLYR